MKQFNIVLSGKQRENEFEASVISNIEHFTKSLGGSTSNENLYFYSFELNTNPNNYPSGVLNADFFSKFEFQYLLYPPPLDPLAKFKTFCDFDSNTILGTSKDINGVYKYMYIMSSTRWH